MVLEGSRGVNVSSLMRDYIAVPIGMHCPTSVRVLVLKLWGVGFKA